MTTYIESNLMPDEQLLHRTKQHWIVFVKPGILGLFAWGMRGTPEAAFLFLTGALYTTVSAWVDYKTSEYGVTNMRVILKAGFIRRVSMETFLSKVEGLSVNQGVLGRLLNFGTIVVRGVGGTQKPFKRISDPMQFRKRVQEEIEASRKKSRS